MTDNYFSNPITNESSDRPQIEQGGFIDKLIRLRQAYPDNEVGTSHTPGVNPVPFNLPASIESPPPIEQKRSSQFSKSRVFLYSIPANTVAGTELSPNGFAAGAQELGFQALSCKVDNPTPYTLFLPEWPAYVPPFVFGYPLYMCASVDICRVVIAQGSATLASTSAPVILYFSELPELLSAPVSLPAASALAATGNTGATPASVTSAANAAGVLTIPAVAGKLNTLLVLNLAASAVSTASGNVMVNFGTVTWTIPLASGAIGGTTGEAILTIPLPSGGVAATGVNTAIVITIPPLGVGVTGTINAASLVG